MSQLKNRLVLQPDSPSAALVTLGMNRRPDLTHPEHCPIALEEIRTIFVFEPCSLRRIAGDFDFLLNTNTEGSLRWQGSVEP